MVVDDRLFFPPSAVDLPPTFFVGRRALPTPQSGLSGDGMWLVSKTRLDVVRLSIDFGAPLQLCSVISQVTRETVAFRRAQGDQAMVEV